MRRLLTPTAALMWGLQLAFLNPALALILVSLYEATAAEVGWVLAIYNAGGFLASLIIPAYADRKPDYLRPLLLCATLTLALVILLALATTLPVAVVGLVVLGGPASVGSSLLYAHLRHSGVSPSEFTRVRAVVSFAWVAGPPLATLIMGTFGNAAVLVAIAIVAALNVITTVIMARRPAGRGDGAEALPDLALPRRAVILVVLAFVPLQATNAGAVSIMSLFVTETLGLDVRWAGLTLGLAAALEIPALLIIGKLNERRSSVVLIISGCVAGLIYYLGMAVVSNLALLLALQVLNAWFVAAIAGIGISFFLQVIPRPGLASGLYANARRIGAVVSGPVIALGSATAWGYAGVFALCAGLTVLGAGLLLVSARRPQERTT